MTALAWLAAGAAAVLYGVASVLQGAGARRARGPAVLAQPLYVVGLACDGLAWVTSLVALRGLPLFVVQSVLAASVAVTVLLARRFLDAPPLRARDVAALGGLVAALAVLAVAFLPGPAVASGGLAAWLLGGGAAVLLALGATYARGGSLLLAAIAGAAFAGAAVAARGVDLTGGAVGVATEPVAWAVLVLGAAGTVAYARALERGGTGPATAVLWSAETVLAGVAGVMLLGDGLRPGWVAAAAVAVAVALAGCAVLAMSPAERAVGTSAA